MTAAARSPLGLSALEALANRFDTFFIDQFGVLHDGQSPYPGAAEALAALKGTGRTVVLLSNSGKRSRPNEQRLEGLGFRPDSWDLFLSSGEVAWRLFAGELGEPRQPPGTRCLLLARDGDESAVEELDFRIVESGEADIVLIAGSEGERFSLDHYRALLEPAVQSGAPAFCTNPDKIMLVGPRAHFGAGRIAELYEEMGGTVTWIGKPFPAIYEAALELAGHPAKSGVVCIGDSIEHDIAGGRGAGLATALVRSGILAGLAADELAALFHEHDAAPDFFLPGFVWTA